MTGNLSARGFTLIEVLVALAVIAIALSGALKLATDNVTNAAALEEKVFAHWVAMNRVAELSMKPESLARGRRQGMEPMAGREWRWVAEVKPSADRAVWRIDVEVRREHEKGGPLATVVAYAPVR